MSLARRSFLTTLGCATCAALMPRAAYAAGKSALKAAPTRTLGDVEGCMLVGKDVGLIRSRLHASSGGGGEEITVTRTTGNKEAIPVFGHRSQWSKNTCTSGYEHVRAQPFRNSGRTRLRHILAGRLCFR
jgi:hypothetical protein